MPTTLTVPTPLARRFGDLVLRADRALYAAKSAGRNQSVVLDKPAPLPVE